MLCTAMKNSNFMVMQVSVIRVIIWLGAQNIMDTCNECIFTFYSFVQIQSIAVLWVFFHQSTMYLTWLLLWHLWEIWAPTICSIRCNTTGLEYHNCNQLLPIASVNQSLKILQLQTVVKLVTSDVYPDVLSNMKGYNYTIATLQYFPFVWKRNGEYDGIEVKLTKFLARRFKFK